MKVSVEKKMCQSIKLAKTSTTQAVWKERHKKIKACHQQISSFTFHGADFTFSPDSSFERFRPIFSFHYLWFSHFASFGLRCLIYVLFLCCLMPPFSSVPAKNCFLSFVNITSRWTQAIIYMLLDVEIVWISFFCS